MKQSGLGQRLRYGAEAAAFFLFVGIFRMVGLDAASALGGVIGRRLLYPSGMTRRARENLKIVFPEKSAAEIETILVTMWDNLGRTFAEYPHLEKLRVGSRITVEGLDIGMAEAARGKGLIFFSGHFANWETMINAGFQLGFEGAYVYRPPNNPYVARYILHKRTQASYPEGISKHQGARRIFALLRAGKAVLLLADQKTNDGIAVPFLGRDAMTTPVPAALALRLGASLVCSSSTRTKGANFHVRIHPSMPFTPSGDEDRDTRALTAQINQQLEAIVRGNPGQWLWIHRRWPTARDVAGKRA